MEAKLGTPVLRISVRRVNEPLVDPEDQEEAERTRVLLDDGAKGIAKDTARLVPRRFGKFADALKAAVQMGYRSDRGVLRHLTYLAEATTIVDWAKAEGVDHIHAHFGNNPAAVALLVKMLGGPSYSFTAHGTETFDYPPFIAVPEKVAHAAFVVAVSDYGKSQLARWSSAEHWDKIHVIRCGADDAFLTGDLVPISEAPRMVCVARFSEEKGHFVLLDAAARLKAKGVSFELVLVGDGHLREKVETKIAEHQLHDHIRLLGWQSNEEVRRAVLDARALVLPSFMEGLPVVLMEALGLGRPVIATHISGIPELVEPGQNGWLVPAGAVDALADAMHQVVTAPVQTLAALGAHGRARVKERHDARQEAHRLVDLFHRYVEQNHTT